MSRQLECKDFFEALAQNNIAYFCGVPDSLLSPFSFFLEDNANDLHTITANEGNAVGQAIGYHAATGEVPLVYMQNSGLGNAVDPLVSLADPSVFRVPMILLLSWRGQPGSNDEPQHVKQGAITTDFLRDLGIPFKVVSSNKDEMRSQVNEAVADSKQSGRPYALIVEKDLFAGYKGAEISKAKFPLSREQAITIIAENLHADGAVVASIGKISRELFEYRKNNKLSHEKDLLIVGGMGHASSIALGIAQQKPGKKVYCLDGDGSMIMHLGALTTIGKKSPKNFYHILINNGVHDSVGGQPTAGLNVSFTSIAEACNYKAAYSVRGPNELKKAIIESRSKAGPVMIEVLVSSGARNDLIRPTIHPSQNKESFRTFLKKNAGSRHA